ncbi:hypothetical protein Tco_0077771 [Tanacetum coccineum]
MKTRARAFQQRAVWFVIGSIAQSVRMETWSTKKGNRVGRVLAVRERLDVQSQRTRGSPRTVGHNVAYAMTWTNLKKMMTDKYCPRGKIKKLEVKMWNLKVKESNKIERYIDGLPDMIHGIVMASKPKNMQDAIEFATKLMDKKIQTFAER